MNLKYVRNTALAVLLSAGAVAALVAATPVGVLNTYVVPVVQSIGANDLFQDVVNGVPVAQSYYATATQLGTYSNTLPGGNAENSIVGGDFTTGMNLFQDGTPSSITTTITYVADQWASWSGASTPITATQQTGSTDITAGFGGSLRINKGSLTGVVSVCTTQEIDTAESYRYQGQTAEFDFHALAGAGFSAANSNLNVSIVTGTGTNEGISKLAFAFNAGGGGSSTWAGQANAASNIPVTISTVWGRYTVVAPIPATATEIAVIICYTPVGTGTSTDWFEFTGAQLVPNPALASVAGTAGAWTGIVNDPRAKAFYRRPVALEQQLQYSYYYRINEVNGAYYATGEATASNVESAVLPLPTAMRTLPTCSFTAGGLKWNNAGSQLAVSSLACTAANNTPNVVTVTDTATATAGDAMMLTGSSTTGVIKVSARF